MTKKPINREAAIQIIFRFNLSLRRGPIISADGGKRRGLDKETQLGLFDPNPRPQEIEPSTPDLDALFAQLNRTFFDGRLSARVGWSERLTASAGSCRCDRGIILISALYHRRRPDAIRTTMAHEMCHLLVPNHGPAFRALAGPVAAALGVTYDQFRFAERWADLKRYRYLYTCAACGLEFPSKKRKRLSCAVCAPGVYDERFRMALAESRAKPGPVLLGERAVNVGP